MSDDKRLRDEQLTYCQGYLARAIAWEYYDEADYVWWIKKCLAAVGRRRGPRGWVDRPPPPEEARVAQR